MKKYKIIMIYPDGESEEQDEIFYTEAKAIDYADYLVSCSRVGAETLHWSNPGDYPYVENEFEEPEYEIIEIEK